MHPLECSDVSTVPVDKIRLEEEKRETVIEHAEFDKITTRGGHFRSSQRSKDGKQQRIE